MKDSKLALPNSGGKLLIARAALAMSPYAKAAVAFAVVFAGCAVAWLATLSNSVEPTATWRFLHAHLYEAARAAGATASGRIAVVVLFALAVDMLFLGWRGSSLFRLAFTRSNSAILDIVSAIFYAMNLMYFLQIALTFGGSLLAAKFIAWAFAQYSWSRIALPSDGVLELLISFAIYWLVTSFMQYWGHRLVHTPLFWHVHRIHHAATELNVLTTFRQHPLEAIVLGFVSLVSPLIFLDVPQRVLLIYFFVGTITDLLAHSQLPWGYGWVGRWLVQSPRFHQLHHSIDEEHQDLHFSNCPFWDHLFGTFYKGTKQTSRYGIADPAYEIRPLTQFALDAWIFYANLVRLAARAIRRVVRRPDHRSPTLRNTLSPRRIRPSPGDAAASRTRAEATGAVSASALLPQSRPSSLLP
jgi:sterol desaturase/sphingolipid hydroxylase (fatty acid hydroxylase superfamily)